ncbi:MAG: hypothetical protein EXQ85_00985 [Alphaproteobacteria bacterium]|nr:hypothetical protein [Alphaproteobacteria bacterium]
MIEVVSVDQARRERRPLMVAYYTLATSPDEGFFVTRYVGALPDTVDPSQPAAPAQRLPPQAYLVEQPARSLVPAHYHDTNQFQVFVSGGAVFGKRPIGAVRVHFAGGHTPYGPIRTDDRPAEYFTFRNRWDSGGKTMPDNRPNLRRVARRFRLVHDLPTADAGAVGQGLIRCDDVLPCEPDGLGVAQITFGPGATGDLTLARPGAGRHALVLAGHLRVGSTTLDRFSSLYAGPADTCTATAGDTGAVVLVLQFPPEPADVTAH